MRVSLKISDLSTLNVPVLPAKTIRVLIFAISLNKMKCCEKISSMDNEELKVIFADLKNEIDDLIKIYTGEHNET